MNNSSVGSHPFVSVIVIVYNMEKTIKKCLDSLFRQTYPRDRYEVIVVDGGSTDGTRKIIDEYDVVFLVEKRKVRGYARNLGIKNAKGKIMLFIDADCSAESGWLMTHVDNHVGNPRLGAVGGSMMHLFAEVSDVRAKFSRPIVALNAGEYLPSASRRYVLQIPTSNASFRRGVFEEVGLFDENLHVGEDAELCLRILEKGYKILFDPKACVLHYNDYHFRQLANVQSCLLGRRIRLFMHIYFRGGRVHYKLQRKRRSLNYFMLPMSSFLIIFLFFGLVGIRFFRNLHKMRYSTPKLIRYFPYILLASISWVSGYFFESVGG